MKMILEYRCEVSGHSEVWEAIEQLQEKIENPDLYY